MASVGSRIEGSGTWSTLTFSLPCQTTAFTRGVLPELPRRKRLTPDVLGGAHRVDRSQNRSDPGRYPMEAGAQETGQVTGTKDKDYNIIWFVEQCLSNVLRLETYAKDAERDGDSELAEFFRRAQGESRKGAEQGKEHLRKRLAG